MSNNLKPKTMKVVRRIPRKERLKILKRVRAQFKIGTGDFICNEIERDLKKHDKYADVMEDIYSKKDSLNPSLDYFPEIKRYKPLNLSSDYAWFIDSADGTKRRIHILNLAIKRLKYQIS